MAPGWRFHRAGGLPGTNQLYRMPRARPSRQRPRSRPTNRGRLLVRGIQQVDAEGPGARQPGLAADELSGATTVQPFYRPGTAGPVRLSDRSYRRGQLQCARFLRGVMAYPARLTAGLAQGDNG